MQDKLVTIVVVNWKVKDLLRDCLASVYLHMDSTNYQTEIIVVDNNSNDGSVEMLGKEYPAVQIIANDDNPGFGKANNQAFQVATGKYILLLNPDTLLLENTVGIMLSYFELNPNLGALGCRLLNADRSFQRWTGGSFPSLWNIACHYLFIGKLLPERLFKKRLYLDSDIPEEKTVDWLSGACLMLRREAIGKTIFNEDYYMYGEDMELCYRLNQNGWDILYTPKTSIVHYQGQSMIKQKGAILKSSIKGPRLFFSKNRNKLQLALFDLVTIAGFFVRSITFGVVSIFKSKQYASKAKSSWQYMRLAIKIMKSN